jgi:transposase
LQTATQALIEIAHAHKRRIELAAALTNRSDAPPVGEVDAREPLPAPRVTIAQQEARARGARWLGRWEEVQGRQAAGQSLRQIARDLGMHRRTVRRLLALPQPEATQRAMQPRPGGLTSPTLAPYVPYLQDRWQAGCTNILQLHRERVAQGYTGSRSLLSTALQAWRPSKEERAARQQERRRRRRRVSVRSLCVRPPEQLDAAERAALAALLEQIPEPGVGHGLVQRFRAMLAERDLPGLDAWHHGCTCEWAPHIRESGRRPRE